MYRFLYDFYIHYVSMYRFLVILVLIGGALFRIDLDLLRIVEMSSTNVSATEVSPLLVTFLPDEEDKHVKEHELQILENSPLFLHSFSTLNMLKYIN